MKRFIPCCLAAFALAVPAAHAAEPLDAAYQRALAYWQVASPPGCSSVTLEDLTSGGEDGGEATQTVKGEPPVPCSLAVDPTLRRCEFEQVTRHEVGHLLGLGHIEDRLSTMNPESPEGLLCDEALAKTNLRIVRKWRKNLGHRPAPNARQRFLAEEREERRELRQLRRKGAQVRAADLLLK